MTKQLNTKSIMDALNSLAHNIELAICDFTDNQNTKDKGIKQMENRFRFIQDLIDSYFTIKKIKNTTI